MRSRKHILWTIRAGICSSTWTWIFGIYWTDWKWTAARLPTPRCSNRWRKSIDHLEISHPTLTTLLSQVLTTLSNAGI